MTMQRYRYDIRDEHGTFAQCMRASDAIAAANAHEAHAFVLDMWEESPELRICYNNREHRLLRRLEQLATARGKPCPEPCKRQDSHVTIVVPKSELDELIATCKKAADEPVVDVDESDFVDVDEPEIPTVIVLRAAAS